MLALKIYGVVIGERTEKKKLANGEKMSSSEWSGWSSPKVTNSGGEKDLFLPL